MQTITSAKTVEPKNLNHKFLKYHGKTCQSKAQLLGIVSYISYLLHFKSSVSNVQILNVSPNFI